MEGEIKHLTSIWLWVLSSLCYCYFISSRLPKGKYRLLSLLPIFYLFTILPLSLSHLLPTAITTFFISWLGNFKLLLFSFDKGPLSMGPPKSLPLFITIGSLPIIIKKNTNTNTNPSPQHSQKSTNLLKKSPLYFAFEIILLATFVTLWPDYKEYILIYQMATLALYGCGLFIVIDLVMASAHVVVRALVGLELEPPSNEPYFSTSLQDFWGRRWNLTATNILRITVFQPVRVATSNLFGDMRATMLGYFATFFVSGLMHELLLYNLTRRAPTGEMASFFMLHGVCVIGEIMVKRALMDRFRLPEFVSRSLTLGFVLVTAYWIFFPPILRNSLDVKLIEEFTCVLDFVKRKVNMII